MCTNRESHEGGRRSLTGLSIVDACVAVLLRMTPSSEAYSQVAC
jgi:hypothetical protein